MSRHAIRIGCLALGLLFVGTSPAGEFESVDAALKSVGKSMKGVGGIVAEVEWSEVVGKRSIRGSGKIYVDFEGLARVDVEGDLPRTVIFIPPYLYIHRKADGIVEMYDVTTNPDLLGQYVMLGFAPAGKTMKKDFKVDLVQNSTLDGEAVPSFLLTPRDKQAADSIARIQLWVDAASGLPLGHEIVHATGEIRLDVRYREVSRDDALPGSLFLPRWPDGTRTVRM